MFFSPFPLVNRQPIEMYANKFWKNSYRSRKRVDSIDRHEMRNKLKDKHHMTPMEVLREYCNKATLHGIRYTVRERAPTFDRQVMYNSLKYNLLSYKF